MIGTPICRQQPTLVADSDESMHGVGSERWIVIQKRQHVPVFRVIAETHGIQPTKL